MTTNLKIYQSGNTIRLDCKFKDFNGQAIDPPLISVRLYDNKYRLLSQVSIGIGNRLDLGHYFYDYVSPIDAKVIWYEWYAEVGGLPSLKRAELKTSFVGQF